MNDITRYHNEMGNHQSSSTPAISRPDYANYLAAGRSENQQEVAQISSISHSNSNTNSNNTISTVNNSISSEAQAVRLNILNSGMQDARERNDRTNRFVFYATTIFNVPQIIASVIYLSIYWNKDNSCNRIQYWIFVQLLFLIFTLLIEWIVYYFEINSNQLNTEINQRRRQKYLPFINNIKYVIELGSLFWFLVGNMWLINGQINCIHGTKNLYHFGIFLVIAFYIKLFLPCILLIIMIPILCFCLPCVIRFLHNLQDPMKGKGATKEIINKIETVEFGHGLFPEEARNSCCICLNEYEVKQILRILPRCSHSFHKECVDEWLLVNATCPTCRTPIMDEANSENNDEHIAERSTIVRNHNNILVQSV